MTKNQIENQIKYASFLNCIGKLRQGRSTRLNIERDDGSILNYGKITCTSKGVRPRKFRVSSSDVMGNGDGYTYKTIMKNFEI